MYICRKRRGDGEILGQNLEKYKKLEIRAVGPRVTSQKVFTLKFMLERIEIAFVR